MTAFWEKRSSLRLLGAAFLALMLFLVWLSWAFFDHAFVRRVPVYVETSSAGLQLPTHGDVKLRGMIVGEVTQMRSTGHGARLTLGIQPDQLDKIPDGVTAQIVPKTLFGQKFIALIPPAESQPGHLRSGDTITKADVPIEVEKLLNDLYPLLDAVKPAELSYTLSALSTALGGRGEQLGQTMVDLNEYLTQISPDVPALVNDLVQLGRVSAIYGDAIPDVLRLLRNTATTSKTIVSQRQNLHRFFTNTTDLAQTLDAFVTRSGNDLVAVQANAAPVTAIAAKYAPSFPCMSKALAGVEPRIASAFRNGRLHIDGELYGPLVSPTGYAGNEPIALRQQAMDASPVARPNCLSLNEIVATNGDNSKLPYPQSHPFAFTDESLLTLINLKTKHNKFCAPTTPNWGPGYPCTDAAYRSSSAPLDGSDTTLQRAALNVIIGQRTGVPADQVPDVASLLMGPILRGSVVSYR